MTLEKVDIREQTLPLGELGRQIASSMASITLHLVTEIGFRQAEANRAAIARGKSIAALRDSSLMKGESALVIAAGPSLHRKNALQHLKESKFGGKLIVAESSMGWCFRNGIHPDLVVTLDPGPTRMARWFGDPDLTLEQIEADDYYARQDLDPYFRSKELERNRQMIELVDYHGRGMPIAMATCAPEPVVRRAEQAGMEIYWWNPMYDDYDIPYSLTRKIYAMNGLPCINAGGNIGSACWVMAEALLKKKRVGLVGIDFGYYADTPYERTQYYPEIVNLVGKNRLDEVFVWIQNPHLGQNFYTDPAYLWYRDCFLEMVSESNCETWNCTEGGILFGKNIHWASLSQFLTTEGRRVVAA
jgi:hypothetical protein